MSDTTYVSNFIDLGDDRKVYLPSLVPGQNVVHVCDPLGRCLTWLADGQDPDVPEPVARYVDQRLQTFEAWLTLQVDDQADADELNAWLRAYPLLSDAVTSTPWPVSVKRDTKPGPKGARFSFKRGIL